MKAKQARPSKETVTARVQEIARCLLDGALPTLDIVDYVREQEAQPGSPWHVAQGQLPLGYSQIRRYIAKAEALIGKECQADIAANLRRHLGQRRALYQKAVAMGDVRAALACLDSEAKLLQTVGLLPKERKESTYVVGVFDRIASLTEQLRGNGHAPMLESRVSGGDLPGDGNGEPLDQAPAHAEATGVPVTR